MTTLVSGIVALVLGVVFWAYLRVRARQLQWGASFLDEFGDLASELAERDMPTRDLQTLVALTYFAGTGHIVRHIARRMAKGDLAKPPSREVVAAWRKSWSDFSSSTRTLYVRTFYSALRADSYFAGPVIGTLFRRAVFYLDADPADIAQAVDAWETRVLMLGTERAVEYEAKRGHEPKEKELVTANC